MVELKRNVPKDAWKRADRSYSVDSNGQAFAVLSIDELGAPRLPQDPQELLSSTRPFLYTIRQCFCSHRGQGTQPRFVTQYRVRNRSQECLQAESDRTDLGLLRTLATENSAQRTTMKSQGEPGGKSHGEQSPVNAIQRDTNIVACLTSTSSGHILQLMEKNTNEKQRIK